MKKALITGVTGQDGSYLAELLLDKGYEVYGLRRSASLFNTGRIDHILNFRKKDPTKLTLIYGDLIDSSNLNRVVSEVQPDEIYNLAAQSHVHLSFQVPDQTAQVDALGTLRILDSIKSYCPNARFYQASTSELFGNATQSPQNENTAFRPRSPYAVAKLYAYWTTVNYREAYNIFACNGILFNHESPRRGKTFVTRKITQAVSKIFYGIQEKLYLGNLDAKRDWGYAKDYVEAMWLMLQQEKPTDLVIASGETHTVREFCQKAFEVAGIEIVWVGEGENEKGLDRKTGKTLVEVDPIYFRPIEVDLLLGDCTKAKSLLGWEPKVAFNELIELMVRGDMDEISKEINNVAKNIPDYTDKKVPFKEIEKCRLCGNTELKQVLNLGESALTGVFPFPHERVASGPLALVKCMGEDTCGLLQLQHNCDLDVMYGSNYGYRSGLNKSMVKHLDELVSTIKTFVTIQPGDLIVDIGSNDGTMLSQYKVAGAKYLGVDPTADKFAEYYQPGIDKISDFFSADIVKSKYTQKAKVVTSIAMFYDLPDPLNFAKDVSCILAEDGVWMFELSYMPHMLRNDSYDTVCHEHLEYYSMKQVKWIADKTDLKIIDISFNETNGASVCVTLAKKESNFTEATDKLNAILAVEISLGLDTLIPYEDFEKRIVESKHELLHFLMEAKKSGRRVIGYGASTKGNVILQYCGIGSSLLPLIAEVNEYKFGRVTPGTEIPIIPEKEARLLKPDYFLVLPWHFKQVIIGKESEYLASGGHLVFPLPKLEII